MTAAIAVIDIVARQFNLPQSTLTPHTRFGEDIAADSLDLTEILMTIERETGADLIAVDTDDLHSIADLIVATDKALTAGGQP